MANPMRLRISMASIMVLVVAAATASALFAKIAQLVSDGSAELKYDVPAIVVLGIALTAIALGTLRDHSGVQVMIQATVACLGFLSLIWIIEGGFYRVATYWFQALFASLVVFPLLARRFTRAGSEREDEGGRPRRMIEVLPLAFGNMILVCLGLWIQGIAAMYIGAIIQIPQNVTSTSSSPVAVEPDDGQRTGRLPGGDGSGTTESAQP